MRRLVSPFAVAVVIFVAVAGYYWLEVHTLLHGGFAYALDDAYIHLGIAKNLGLHGVWGICPQSWSGASSSLLWTVLLGGFVSLFGRVDWLPFCLNVLFTLAMLWQLDKLLGGAGLRIALRYILLAAAFIVIPLASEPFVGMEVALECFLVLVFYRVSLFSSRQSLAAIAVASFLLGSVRYEAILLIVLVALGFVLQGKRTLAIAMALSAVVPAAIYAVLSSAYGGAIVPNTIFIKAARLQPLLTHPSSIVLLILIALVALALVYLISRRAKALEISPDWILIASVAIAFVVQFQSVTVHDQFERYYSYIYISLLLLVGLLLAKPIFRRRPWSLSLVPLIVLVAIFAPNAWEYKQNTATACKNIHDEHVRMADFIRHAAPGGPVALVDIGAVSYLTDAQIIDVIGLGSNDVARAWIDHPSDPSPEINSIINSDRAKFGLLYPVLHYTPEASWRLVGSVAIDSNYICARDSVQVYAIGADPDFLKQQLESLSARTGIQTRIY